MEGLRPVYPLQHSSCSYVRQAFLDAYFLFKRNLAAMPGGDSKVADPVRRLWSNEVAGALLDHRGSSSSADAGGRSDAPARVSSA